jgi:NADH:ubiquinone oxidoreductase subunit K
MPLELQAILSLAALLFSVGLIVLLTKPNAILMLIGIELMLNAANLNLIAFNKWMPGNLDGQGFTLFIIIIAVCEAALGMAIILRVYHYFKTSDPTQITALNN